MANYYDHFFFTLHTQLTLGAIKNVLSGNLIAITKIGEAMGDDPSNPDVQEMALEIVSGLCLDADDAIVFSDDEMTYDVAACIVSMILDLEDSSAVLHFQVAHVCDKNRPNSFGGTLLVINRYGFEAMWTGNQALIDQLTQQLPDGHDA